MAVTDKRFAELVERVAALERRQSVSTGDVSLPPPADPSGVFWALEELKRREPLPSVLYAGAVETSTGNPVQWQKAHLSVDLLEEDWASRTTALTALGHPSRLRILQLVARGEARTAADLAHSDGLGTTGQIYHHVRLLVSAGWLRSTTKGQHEIPPERLVPLLVVLAASR